MLMSKLTVSIILLTAAAGTAAAEGLPADSGQWTKIADGVYQRVGLDGTIYRDSVGDAGARYELEQWKSELAEMQLSGRASRENLQNVRTQIANIEQYLSSSKPEVGPDATVSFDNPPNFFCGFVAHQMADAWHWSLPGGGPSGSTASIVYLTTTASSGAPTANFFVKASITPLNQSNTTVTGTSSLSYTSPAGSAFLLTKTTGPQGGAFQGSYLTNSSITVSGCSGGFNQFTQTGTIN